MNGKVGLAVMRVQPLHKGHTRLINNMCEDCQTVIVCLGSAQISRVENNPWTVDERKEMIKNVYGDRIKIVPLTDLGAKHPMDWTNYIFDKLEKLGMKQPTDYYTGSVMDARWYTHCFYSREICETVEHDLSICQSLQQSVNFQHPSGITRQLHIIDRHQDMSLAATEVRGHLQLRSTAWKELIPAVNHELISSTYPDEFKVPLTAS